MLPKLGKLLLYSNNGSLHIGQKNKQIIFSSEKYILENFHVKKFLKLEKR